jgi:WD40 repeat protein
MERPVALKIISQSLTTKPGMVERFAREAKAAARLSHPNIVTAFDAEEAGGTHFLVMEHVEGTDLSRHVQELGPLSVDRACDYVRQSALGLQHAFEKGMVHRDVKPHNLMLTPDGRVKILDFGLARLASEAVSEEVVTATGMVLGTVDYVAPEQAYNAHHADIRSDIYSLGCTLYYLLAGKPPFPVGSPLQKMMDHSNKAPTPLAEFRQDIPEKLIPVLERMMAKNPKRRYQTPAEVALALEQFTTATAVASAPKSGFRAGTADHGRTVVLETTPVRGRRRRKFVIVTAILLIAVTGLLGMGIYRIATDNGELVIQTDNEDVELVVTKNGKVVKIIDTTTGKTVNLHSGDYELSLKDDPDGLRLSPGKMKLKRGQTVLATIERVGMTEAIGEVRRFHGQTGAVRAAAFSADGRYILTCSGPPATDKSLRLWDEATGSEVRRFEGHTSQIDAVAMSPDGRLAVSGGEDRTARLWDLATGKELRQLNGELGWVMSVAFSADGTRLVTGSHDTSLRLWDPATGMEVRRFEGHEGPVEGVAFSPDGERISSGSWDGTVRVWNAVTGKELNKLAGHMGRVQGVAYSPDGKRVLSGGIDKTLRLWDVESGKELRTLQGHKNRINCVAFSPDGHHALSASEDKTVRLWDVETGREVCSFAGHKKNVWSVAFSADGRYAISVGEDGTARQWRLPDSSPPAKVGEISSFKKD